MPNRQGFSFAEVMFAVVILGIGLIMVAAVFPVAAQQTQSTNDQSVAAQIGRDAFHTIQSSMTSLDFPCISTDTLPFGGLPVPPVGPWGKLAGSMICTSDKRYAWVPFYRKPDANSPILLTVVVVRRNLHGSYQAADVDPGSGALVPRLISITQISNGSDGLPIAQIDRDTFNAYQCVGPGAILVVTSSGSGFDNRVLQISELVGETSNSVFWKLLPGYGIDPKQVCTNVIKAAVIGKDFVNGVDTTDGYGGAVQDVSAFTGFFNPQ